MPRIDFLDFVDASNARRYRRQVRFGTYFASMDQENKLTRHLRHVVQNIVPVVGIKTAERGIHDHWTGGPAGTIETIDERQSHNLLRARAADRHVPVHIINDTEAVVLIDFKTSVGFLRNQFVKGLIGAILHGLPQAVAEAFNALTKSLLKLRAKLGFDRAALAPVLRETLNGFLINRQFVLDFLDLIPARINVALQSRFFFQLFISDRSFARDLRRIVATDFISQSFGLIFDLR